LESYHSFFDHAWAQRLDHLAEHSKLEQVVFDLVSSWKAIGSVREWPWLMMHSMKTVLEAEFPKRHPISVQIVQALEQRLASGMGLFPLSSDQRRQLYQTLVMLREQMFATDKANPRELAIKVDEHWKGFVAIPDFALRLWKSEQNAYGAIYYAYEDFLTRCTGLARGEPEYSWLRAAEFANDLSTCFGNQLQGTCWDDPTVNISRLVRNAIVHNGGRITKHLEKLNHGLHIEGEEVTIVAPDTTSLFHSLKDRALQFTESALQLRALC
jgi:hypothetical protein